MQGFKTSLIKFFMLDAEMIPKLKTKLEWLRAAEEE